MNLTGLLNDALSGNTVNQISQTIGADEGTTANAIQAAVPLLLGGLARNSQSPEGASSLLGALDRDHDGSVLDDLGGFLAGAAGGSGAGAGILGHVFGGQQSQIAQGVSTASGLDMNKVGPLLAMLAPIVMGALGRSHQQQGGLDPSSLAGMLGGAQNQMASGSPIMDMLGGLLDQNHDGSAVDDVIGMAGKLFGGR